MEAFDLDLREFTKLRGRVGVPIASEDGVGPRVGVGHVRARPRHHRIHHSRAHQERSCGFEEIDVLGHVAVLKGSKGAAECIDPHGCGPPVCLQVEPQDPDLEFALVGQGLLEQDDEKSAGTAPRSGRSR